MSWRRFLRRETWDRERREEIESYIRIETDENIARGMTPADARAAANKKLGNSTRVREEIYRMNTVAFLDTLSRDMRYGLRALRHNPTFTAVALLTLAIGIGANTAVFSVVNSVLLKPLPYPQPDQLVAIRQMAPGAAGLANVGEGLPLSESMYVTYSENNRTFQSIGVSFPGTANVTGLGNPEQVPAIFVTGDALSALDVPPVLGRWLTTADNAPGSPAAVMLSYGYWQRRFGGDPSVIGRSVRIDEQPRQIIGVMPQGFRFVDADFSLLLPILIDRSKLILAGFGCTGVGRLKPGVSIAQANADLARMLPIWMDSWSNGPGTNPHFYDQWRITPALRLLGQDVAGNVAGVLWVLMGTIGIVMLVACANVANLLLARAETRQQEMAIRAALGAGWSRIVRELLIESVLLGLIGGALGVGVAYLGLRFLVKLGPANLPRLSEISLDARAMLFTVALAVFSGLLFGFIPAVKYAGAKISTALRGAGRNAGLSRERHRTRNMLVVAEVAMALVLLIGAGLMIRTFQTLRTVQPGFTHAEQLQTVRISIPPPLVREPVQVTRMQNNILDKLAAIPGVSSVGFADSMPMDGFEDGWDQVMAQDRPNDKPGEVPLRLFHFISPGFLPTSGTRLIAGRDFDWNDLYNVRPVAIVSENLARELWGAPSAAIGKRIASAKVWHEVVGVVEDVRHNGVDKPAPAQVYWPAITQIYSGAPIVQRTATFVIRSSRTGTNGFLSEIAQAVWSVNASLPLASVRTMRDIYDKSLARTSFTLVMLGIAGAMALVLGIIGIYGMISYSVSQRRREIGIRLALGAEPWALKRMFVRQALTLAAIGVAIGLCASTGLMRVIQSLLFGISPLDPVTYALVPIVLATAAMLASYLPARRVARVDPVEALRE
jgi:putative ABC transport system permease protein